MNQSIKCFSFNNLSYYNLDQNPIYFNNPDNLNIKLKTTSAYLIKHNNHFYIIHNNIIYDYEKYILHSILIKIGVVIYDEDQNINLKIDRHYKNLILVLYLLLYHYQ